MEISEAKKVVAEKIIKRLKELDISRKAFAIMMKVRPSVVTRWLSGTNNFEVNTLFEIERVLGISFFKYD